MSWDSDKTIGGATVSGSEWNTMVGVINSKISTIFPITLTIPSTHGSYYGSIGTFTSGESTILGDVLYYKSDGKLWKTDADAVATSKGMLLMSIGTTTSSASASYLYSGLIANSSWAFAVGDTLYLSTSSGLLQSSVVTGSSDVVRIAGYALSSSVVYFNPDDTYVELT